MKEKTVNDNILPFQECYQTHSFITLSNARKVLGRSASGISDEQLEREILITEFLFEIVLMIYENNKNNILKIQNE